MKKNIGNSRSLIWSVSDSSCNLLFYLEASSLEFNVRVFLFCRPVPSYRFQPNGLIIFFPFMIHDSLHYILAILSPVTCNSGLSHCTCLSSMTEPGYNSNLHFIVAPASARMPGGVHSEPIKKEEIRAGARAEESVLQSTCWLFLSFALYANYPLASRPLSLTKFFRQFPVVDICHGTKRQQQQQQQQGWPRVRVTHPGISCPACLRDRR